MGRPPKPPEDKFVSITVRVPRRDRDRAVAACEGGTPLTARLARAVSNLANPENRTAARPSLMQREVERRAAEQVEPRFKGKS